MLKSTDGGTTWNTTGLSFSASQKITLSRLILDPTSGNQTIYAATSTGVFKTTDGGTNWPQQLWGNFIDLEMNPGNSSVLYASTIDHWLTPMIYYTTNGGSNWTASSTPFTATDKRVDLAVTAANSNYVYAVVANRNGGLSYVCRSTNAGASFSTVYTGSSTTNLLSLYANESGGTGGQGYYDLAIAVSPINANEVYVGGINTHKSTDGGSSWNCVNCWTWSATYNNVTPQAPVVHADHHFLAFQNNTTLFECNDGGLYKTTNGGGSWADKTNTMVISQLYRLGVSQTVSSDVITGLQDNGTKVLATGPGWMDVIGGDGMECIIDHTNVNVQFGTLYFGDIFKTVNYWGGQAQINPANGAWVSPYVMDPTNNMRLVAGYADVWLSTNGGANWGQISNNLTGSGTTYLRSVAIAPSNSNTIYVATLNNIWKTTNSGGNWINITGTLPVGSSNITYITVKNSNPNTVWVSFGEYNTHSVYQTTNGGTNWTNISAGLPSLPVMCVIQNTQNTTQDELYAGTDVGVYVKVGSANWAAFSTSLPNVVVTELDIYYDAVPANSLIRAATFGRGLWESDLYSPMSAPDADFIADNLTPTILDTVSFTDLSTNSPTTWLWTFTPATITYLNGTSGSSQNPQVRFDVPGAYTVSLTATNAGGSDTETKTNYINATDPPPLADFSADNLNPTTIDTVHFTDLSGNNPVSWLWNFTPATISFLSGTDQNSQHPVVFFNDVALYTVQLIASNAGGSDTMTKVDYINALEALTVTVTAGSSFVCLGDSTQLFSAPAGGTGTYTYSWTSDPAGFNSNEQNPFVTPDQNTTYFVTVDDGNHQATASIDISVLPLPVITLGSWPDLLCHYQEPPVQLTASPAGGTFSGNAVTPDGVFSPEIAPLGWNVITYTYTNADGCTASAQDSIYVDNCVGIIENNDAGIPVTIYPNPNSGIFSISSSLTITKIIIRDMTGKKVFDKSFSEENILLNVTFKGRYLLQIFVADKKSGSQIIIKPLIVF